MISVVMATYNGEKYILEQLNSIWNQTQRPDEIIISDDHSSDKTVSIIQQFAEVTSAPILLLQNKNRTGYRRNFFQALKAARGDIVFLSDQDDVWDKRKIEFCSEIMKKELRIQALSTGYFIINERGQVVKRQLCSRTKIRRKISFQAFLRHPKYPGMAMAVRRELMLEVLKLQPSRAAHDWQLNQLAARNGTLFYWGVPLTYYRQHGNNTVGMTQFCNTRKVLQRRWSMLEDLLENLDTLQGVTGDDQKFIDRLRIVLQKRMDLLENRSGLALLIYDFLNLKYVSLRSLVGDVYVCLN